MFSQGPRQIQKVAVPRGGKSDTKGGDSDTNRRRAALAARRPWRDERDRHGRVRHEGVFAMRASALGTSALGADFRHRHARSRGGCPAWARPLSGRSSGMGTSAMGRLSAIRVGMVLFARDFAAGPPRARDPGFSGRSPSGGASIHGQNRLRWVRGTRPAGDCRTPPRAGSICTIPERTAENRQSRDLDRVAGSVASRPGRSKPLYQAHGRITERDVTPGAGRHQDSALLFGGHRHRRIAGD